MIILSPMRPEAFESFAEEAIAGYATDNVQSGRWPSELALERSRAEFHRLLHQGLQTPGHFVFEIQHQPTGEPVGVLWFAIIESGDVRSGYVYNIRIHPDFRGRGYAKAALDLIEKFAISQGLSSLALHVFSFNTGAQALYRSIGYGISGMNMFKPLRRDGM